jgi:tetratricopeptide (TPR) repeat protein
VSALKEKGNAALAQGDFVSAIADYTEAISLDPKNHVLYSNRSAAHAKNKDYLKSLDDADRCVELEPAWVKGHCRRGSALAFLHRYEESLASYRRGLEIEPDNPQCLAGISEVIKQDRPSRPIPPEVFATLQKHPKTKEWLNDPDYVRMIQVWFPLFVSTLGLYS